MRRGILTRRRVVEMWDLHVETRVDMKDCSASAMSSICLIPCLATVESELRTFEGTLLRIMNVWDASAKDIP